jgi:predicted nucleic acid-binding protein
MNVIDTNVWIYSHDSWDPNKQLAAQQLINAVNDLALPWQVGCEFIAASRKLIPFGFDESKAWAALAAMRAMANQILIPVPDLWLETQALQQRHSLSFWDGLLVATCIRGGVQKLYTEDVGAPRQIETVSLVNPFSVP